MATWNPLAFWTDWWAKLSWADRIGLVVFTVFVLVIIFISPAWAANGEAGSQAIWAALITVVSVQIISPFVVAYIAKQNRKDDWARQDAVADKVERAAERLAANTLKVAEAAKDAASSTGHKLDAIHLLVNSNLTQEIQNKLTVTKLLLISLEKGASLQRSHGSEVTNDDLMAIAAAKKSIAEISTTLDDRLKQG